MPDTENETGTMSDQRTLLEALTIAVAAMDAESAGPGGMVASWESVERVLDASRALVGLPRVKDAVSEQPELPGLTV